MKRNSKNALLLCAMIVATGCGDNGNQGGTPALAPLSGEARFAVVSSDFSSTSVAMLDADFQPLDERWIDSGTTFPGLVATLSGDVVLPNRQAGDGTFALVDRLSTNVVSRFYVPSGNLNGQVGTQGPGFSSNPRDFVFVDETSAWVPRYEQNLDPSAAPEDKGTDLLEVEPSTMTLTGGRIDLSSLNTTAIAMGDDGPVEVDVYARPSRAVLVGSILIVGLDRLSTGFDAAGPGMAAVVDLADQSVEGLPLGEGLKNCGNAVPVPGAANKVIVSCLGFAQVFGDEAATRASAGVVLLTVDSEGATIETTWRASTSESSAIAVNHLVALDESRVAGVNLGDSFAETGDAMSITNLGTGAQQLVHETTRAFQIGISAYDPDTEMLFVPDGDENAVIEYAISTDGATEVGSIQLAPGPPLLPRGVYLLD
jgi:hypothetical protein